MKTYQMSLEESMNLIEVDRKTAEAEFIKGSNIYIKLSRNIWMMFSNSVDSCLEKFESGIKYFITKEYDEDKLIVTRHKNIAQYFRSKGINAKVIEYARPADVMNKTLYGGNIPAHLMSFAKECYIMRVDGVMNTDFDEIPYDQFKNFNMEIKRYEVHAEKVDM